MRLNFSEVVFFGQFYERMAAEAKPAKKPMPKLPFQSKASEPKPAVSEPRPLEAQGEPAADDKWEKPLWSAIKTVQANLDKHVSQ